MDAPTPFARWLKVQRKRVGLTQEELGARVGADRTYINKIERGKIELPLLETRQRLHAVLGTSEDDLRHEGIVRDVVIHAPAATATASAPAPTVTVTASPPTAGGVPSNHRDKNGVSAKAFLASLTDEQRSLLMRWIQREVAAAESPPGEDDLTDEERSEASGA